MTTTELKVELEKLVELSEQAAFSYEYCDDDVAVADAEARDNQIGHILDIFGDM